MAVQTHLGHLPSILSNGKHHAGNILLPLLSFLSISVGLIKSLIPPENVQIHQIHLRLYCRWKSMINSLLPYEFAWALPTVAEALLSVPSACEFRQPGIKDRAFSVTAPRQWKSLLVELYYAPTLSVFRWLMKTFSFQAALRVWSRFSIHCCWLWSPPWCLL